MQINLGEILAIFSSDTTNTLADLLNYISTKPSRLEELALAISTRDFKRIQLTDYEKGILGELAEQVEKDLDSPEATRLMMMMFKGML